MTSQHPVLIAKNRVARLAASGKITFEKERTLINEINALALNNEPVNLAGLINSSTDKDLLHLINK